MIDKLELDNLKELERRCNPLPVTDNFQILCGLAIMFVGMVLRKEIENKNKLRR